MKRMTSRIRLVQEQGDFPEKLDEAAKNDLKKLFNYVGSHYPEREGLVITGPHGGIAVAARNPRFANQLLEATHSLVDKDAWGGKYVDLREIAVQVVNLYYRCDLSFQSHLAIAKDGGLSLEKQAALPYWRTAAHMFSEDERLVIEYTFAVLSGDVPEELFNKVVGKYGEREAVECTAAVAVWAAWAMLLNATDTHFDFGYGSHSR